MNLLTVSVTVAFFVGAGTGYKMTADHYQSAQAKQERATAEAYQARTVELNNVSADLEKSRHDRKIVYRTITRDVEKVVTRDLYRNVCLDDSGVQLVNAALAGKSASAGEPANAMPAAGAAAGSNGR